MFMVPCWLEDLKKYTEYLFPCIYKIHNLIMLNQGINIASNIKKNFQANKDKL